jgi:cytoskeletal protein CcmA (bactofilin family)
MWKKDDDPKQPGAIPSTSTAPPPPERPRPAPPTSRSEQATIGRSITIRGDVTGDEDLMIQGRIEGTVNLQQHNVTIGPEGRVKANVTGRTVTIEGEVDGDVRGTEQVALRAASRVHGDSFLGSIDMSAKSSSATPSKPVPARDADSDKAESKTSPSPTSHAGTSRG